MVVFYPRSFINFVNVVPFLLANTIKFVKGKLLLHFIIGSRSGFVIKISLTEGLSTKCYLINYASVLAVPLDMIAGYFVI